jgi:vacuolar-type H+-ATPase subunit I/STV1
MERVAHMKKSIIFAGAVLSSLSITYITPVFAEGTVTTPTAAQQANQAERQALMQKQKAEREALMQKHRVEREAKMQQMKAERQAKMQQRKTEHQARVAKMNAEHEARMKAKSGTAAVPSSSSTTRN